MQVFQLFSACFYVKTVIRGAPQRYTTYNHISPVNTPVTPQAALSGIGYLWQGCKLYLPVDYVSSEAEVGH